MRRYNPPYARLCAACAETGVARGPASHAPRGFRGLPQRVKTREKAATRRDQGLGYAHRQGVAQRLTSTDENTEQKRKKQPKRAKK